MDKRYYVVPLCDAAYRGAIDEIDELIRQGADINEPVPHDERTPLHFAVMGDDLSAVKHLVAKGATLKPDRFGVLAMHEANHSSSIRQYLQELPLNVPYIDCDDDDLPSELHDQKRKVFQFIVKEGFFPYNLIKEEIEYFYTKLGVHPKYFQHFSAAQISRHIHNIIAAKKVSQTTGSNTVSFKLEDERSAFFLTTLGDPRKSREMTFKVAKYLSETPSHFEHKGYSCTFMASEGPIFAEGSRALDDSERYRLGIYIVDRKHFEKVYPADETDLELIATRRFLESRSPFAKDCYQKLLNKVVIAKSAVIQVVEGQYYPGEAKGFVVQFAATGGRDYIVELNQCFRYCNCQPKRYYVETFANGTVTYVCFFPTAERELINTLCDTIRYVAHFKQTPGRSQRVWDLVMSNSIRPATSVYFLHLVKFCYSFFRKEDYYPQYNELVTELKNFPSIRFKLEEMYRQSVFEVMTAPKIYDILIRHRSYCEEMYNDFEEISTGKKKPFLNERIWNAVERDISDNMERQVLQTFLLFNEALMCTNFFKADCVPAAIAYRFDPSIVLRGRSASAYPETPFGIYLVCGRGFYGFHVRFREISRGGIRLIKSRTREAYEKNASALFEETYNLAYTQHLKNKDIPESGSKGTILLNWIDTDYATKGAQLCFGDSFIKYVDSLLDIMMADQSKIFSHLKDDEILFFGPDENTADLMDAGALRARQRGYKFWKSLTTGKSTELGGVPHDVYGITTTGVHQYVLCLLDKLNVKEEDITKFQTGGPDGDLGSNEVLISKDKTIAIVDGSGVIYDPLGLARVELTRLAKLRKTVSNFSKTHLGPDGFLYTVDDTDITLPDGSFWRTGTLLRDSFHFSHYASADLFVPCGGRPASVTGANVMPLCKKDLQWKYVVEGANLFFTNDARAQLESAGVHVFRDASANKGGVTSSSLEVLGSLCMSEKEHNEYLTVKKGETPSDFYKSYVTDILNTVRTNATLEFEAIWRQWKANPSLKKFEITAELSDRINRIHDTVLQHLRNTDNSVLTRSVLSKSLSPTLMSKISVEQVIANVPKAYVEAMVCSWIASRFVYSKDGGEFEFYLFLTDLMDGK